MTDHTLVFNKKDDGKNNLKVLEEQLLKAAQPLFWKIQKKNKEAQNCKSVSPSSSVQTPSEIKENSVSVSGTLISPDLKYLTTHLS